MSYSNVTKLKYQDPKSPNGACVSKNSRKTEPGMKAIQQKEEQKTIKLAQAKLNNAKAAPANNPTLAFKLIVLAGGAPAVTTGTCPPVVCVGIVTTTLVIVGWGPGGPGAGPGVTLPVGAAVAVGEPLLVAGTVKVWVGPPGQALQSVTVVTTKPGGTTPVGWAHEARSPVHSSVTV